MQLVKTLKFAHLGRFAFFLIATTLLPACAGQEAARLQEDYTQFAKKVGVTNNRFALDIRQLREDQETLHFLLKHLEKTVNNLDTTITDVSKESLETPKSIAELQKTVGDLVSANKQAQVAQGKAVSPEDFNRLGQQIEGLLSTINDLNEEIAIMNDAVSQNSEDIANIKASLDQSGVPSSKNSPVVSSTNPILDPHKPPPFPPHPVFKGSIRGGKVN